MKRNLFYKWALATIIAIASFTSAFADTFYTLNGVKYSLDVSKTEAIVYRADTGLTGKITIPQYIEYDSKRYAVSSLGNWCFSGCSSLTSITLPNSITSMGWDCFSYCSSLTNITLPNGITSLGDNCFEGCGSLASITLPNSITSLGGQCFSYCSSLTNITLPNGITSLGFYCFDGCI